MMDAATIAAGAAEWDTVGALIKARGAHDAERLAVEVDGRPLTYGELDRLSDRVAANLAALGVGKGDRVASFAFNCVEQLLAVLGAVWVPLNVSLRGEDLAYSINDSSPKVLVADEETRPKLAEVAQHVTVDLRHFVIGGGATEEAFA